MGLVWSYNVVAGIRKVCIILSLSEVYRCSVYWVTRREGKRKTRDKQQGAGFCWSGVLGSLEPHSEALALRNGGNSWLPAACESWQLSREVQGWPRRGLLLGYCECWLRLVPCPLSQPFTGKPRDHLLQRGGSQTSCPRRSGA